MTLADDSRRLAEGQRRANLGWARILIDELIRGGVRHVALSPGSRSTPLAWAAAERAGLLAGDGSARRGGGAGSSSDSPLALTIHIDERSAAFFALGRSRVSGAPSALVCTSGTAGVNYGPAVVEAWHSHVPLLLLTADRPPELRDSGAWQTIDQTRLYTGFLRWFCDLSAPRAGDADGGTMTRYLRAVAARAASTAVGSPAGPVHLNLPFREPLEPPPSLGQAEAAGLGKSWPGGLGAVSLPQEPAADLRPPAEVVTGRPSGAPWTATAPVTRLPEDAALDALADAIAREPRGLLLAGTSSAPLRHGPAWAEAVAELARAADWPILAEPTGGLRYGVHEGACVLSGYAAVLRHAAWSDAPASVPGMALRFGGSFTWKHVALYLQRHASCAQIVVDPAGAWDEPTRGAMQRVVADPLPLARALCRRLRERREWVSARAAPASAWQAHWRAAEAAVEAARAEAVSPAGQGSALSAPSTAPFHDLLARTLPAKSLIWAANSMAVRDLDSFTAARPTPLFALASRGAAGIDGTLSTALGAAHAHQRPTILLTGDLAFLHDLNGLGQRDAFGDRPGALDLLVVVFDDEGGGIFEHLPVAAQARRAFDVLFTTPPEADLAAAARVYGAPFATARTQDDLALQLATWRATGGLRIVRVPIDRAANTAAHRAFWARTAEALDRTLDDAASGSPPSGKMADGAASAESLSRGRGGS
jgi:2-succinyl-5-enolpyruvyl-6-hydroxy-3-cyclohexene-1-carboxylate synthase